MDNDESSNTENNSWNFEVQNDRNIENNEIKTQMIPIASHRTNNRTKINITSQNQSNQNPIGKELNQNIIYDSDENQITLNIQSYQDDDQYYQIYSSRSSLKNKTDVMRVSRPFSSQAPKRKKMTLFQPSPKPPKLTGPVTYYRSIDKIDKQLQRDFDESLRRKEIKRQMKSPYKENMVRLRSESVRSVRKQLQRNEILSRRQRKHEIVAYRSACEEEYESERRHCQVDYVSKTYRELRIMGV